MTTNKRPLLPLLAVLAFLCSAPARAQLPSGGGATTHEPGSAAPRNWKGTMGPYSLDQLADQKLYDDLVKAGKEPPNDAAPPPQETAGLDGAANGAAAGINGVGNALNESGYGSFIPGELTGGSVVTTPKGQSYCTSTVCVPCPASGCGEVIPANDKDPVTGQLIAGDTQGQTPAGQAIPGARPPGGQRVGGGRSVGGGINTAYNPATGANTGTLGQNNLTGGNIVGGGGQPFRRADEKNVETKTIPFLVENVLWPDLKALKEGGEGVNTTGGGGNPIAAAAPKGSGIRRIKVDGTFTSIKDDVGRSEDTGALGALIKTTDDSAKVQALEQTRTGGKEAFHAEDPKK
ncbi:MAG: hypothetical protein HY077_04480 [Elusimicrobia bacterium]|nr:hypothetical protein [Elusimicrobiota bacterium]